MKMEMKKLPEHHELSTILQRPLPFRLELCHSKGTESISEPNGPLIMCEQLTVMINAFFVARDTRVDRVVSQNAWQYFYNLLLSIPISLCWAHDFCVITSRNAVDGTETTNEKRPDFILHISGLLLLRGEEKGDSTDLHESGAKLIRKMRHWNPMFYGDLPYILGYATSGEQLRLVRIDRNLRAHTICEFQSIFRQAAEVIKAFYNLTFLLYQMHLLSNRIGSSTLMPFRPITNEKRTIQVMDDMIIRTIKRRDRVDFERLADIYSTLRDLNNRVHERTHLQTVRKLDRKWSHLRVQLSPLGNVRTPVDVDEVRGWLKGILTALKYWHSCNYCHGDLRWSNIVHVPEKDSGFWVLIDMDESRKPNTTTIDWNHTLEGHKLSFEHDLYQLGELMNSLSFSLPDDLVDVQNVLLSAVDTPVEDLPTLLLHQLHY
ncbi:hypothetical protein DVH05_002559 [Phytophthora capsici]|nr:hypothetical protein DVH05_002559 [Phytophthora capsici]